MVHATSNFSEVYSECKDAASYGALMSPWECHTPYNADIPFWLQAFGQV